MVVRAAFVFLLCLGLAGIGLGATSAAAQTERGRDYSVRMLFVGNSMIRGIGRTLHKIYRAQGTYAKLGSQSPSIADLLYHTRNGRTRRRIERYPWQLVFLQEQSGSFTSQGYVAAREIDEWIVATGAQTAFLMTWQPRGYPPATYDLLRGEPGGDQGYVPIAFELDAPIAPVGWAVRNAILNNVWFDLWKGRAGRHLGTMGRYLGAYVVHATLTQESPVGLWASPRLDPSQILFLQQIAEDTVFGELAAWNIH